MPLTQDRNTEMKATEVLVVPVAAAKRIYAGALVMVNATGFATPGAVTTGLFKNFLNPGKISAKIEKIQGNLAVFAITVTHRITRAIRGA